MSPKLPELESGAQVRSSGGLRGALLWELTAIRNGRFGRSGVSGSKNNGIQWPPARPHNETKRKQRKERKNRDKSKPRKEKPTKLYGVSFEVDDSAKHDDLPLVERKSAGGPLSFHSFKFEGVFFGF